MKNKQNYKTIKNKWRDYLLIKAEIFVNRWEIRYSGVDAGR